MIVLPRLRVILAAWIFTEVVLFALVAGAIGVPNTILLGLATSFVGFLLLRQGGTAAILRLRSAATGPADRTVFDEVATAVAGLGLMLPGFLSDILAAALLYGPFRRRVGVHLIRFVGGERRPGASGTIDLDPAEWRPADPGTGPDRGGQSAGDQTRITRYN